MIIVMIVMIMLFTMIIMVLCASCADSRHETADSRAGGNADGGVILLCSAIFRHFMPYLVVYIDLYHVILCHILKYCIVSLCKVEAERRKRAALLESEGIMQVCYVCLNVMAMDIRGRY